MRTPESLKGRGILILIAPLIAVLVLLNQLYRVAHYDLSPWKGGGMGMFSTSETVNSRFIRVYLHVDGERIPALYRPKNPRVLNAVQTEPTPKNLNRLKQALEKQTWALRPGMSESISARSASKPELEARGDLPLQVDGVELEVWQLVYRASDKSLSATRIRSRD